MINLPPETIKKIDMVLNLIERMPEDELKHLLDEYKIVEELKGEPQIDSEWFQLIMWNLNEADETVCSLQSQVTSLEQNLKELVLFIKNQHNANHQYDYELSNVAARMGIY